MHRRTRCSRLGSVRGDSRSSSGYCSSRNSSGRRSSRSRSNNSGRSTGRRRRSGKLQHWQMVGVLHCFAASVLQYECHCLCITVLCSLNGLYVTLLASNSPCKPRFVGYELMMLFTACCSTPCSARHCRGSSSACGQGQEGPQGAHQGRPTIDTS
jgi:hypothetical protein